MTSNRKPRGAAASPNGSPPTEGEDTARAMAEEPLAFEEALGRLDETVAALEGGQLALDDALAIFEEGVRLSRRCQELLDRADLRVQRLRMSPGAGGGETASAFTLETLELEDDA